MRKREQVLQEFARAAEAVRNLPDWMLELEQQKKDQQSEKPVEASNSRPARKKIRK